MTNLANKPPLGLKPDKQPKHKGLRKASPKRKAYRASEAGKAGLDHMSKVGALPCCICEAFGMAQNSPTEVHHCKSGRFSFKREIDRHTIPLCHSHHNRLRPYKGDETKLGYHNGQETWEAQYGVDYDYIDTTLDKIERMI